MFKSKPSIVATAVLLSLGLSACGGSSDKKEVEVVNTAPTAVALSANTIVENDVAVEVGTLTATDADTADTHTYAVNDDRFEVTSAGVLKLAAEQFINFEQEPTIALTVTVTDSASNSFEQELTLDVTDSIGVQSVIDGLTIPTTYAFDSKVDTGSSVSYSGQTARQVLLVQLTNYIGGGLADEVEAGTITSGAEAKAALMLRYASTEEQWDLDADDALEITTTPGVKQASLREISSSHKNLQGKIAGNDGADSTQHKDWETELVGWNAKGSITPNGLVEALFDALAANVQTHLDGATREDITGAQITKFYIQEDGTDLKQLIQKFILGAVNFSQGADDYLDHATAGKGLLSANLEGDKSGTKAYTSLEHQFDEGFGYFGAARNYNDYTDLEIRAKDGRDGWNKGYNDIDADGAIDLKAEFNFGNSTNAAKRDLGATVATDFTKQAFDAFLTGRAIINSAVTRELTTDEMETLKEQRDIAVLTWEKAISATVVHYINDTIIDLELLGTANYSADNFADLAKHWSELKGFSLNLQFNPSSPLKAADFATIQEKIGMKPVLTAGEVAAYKAELLEARAILEAAYSFNAENVANW